MLIETRNRRISEKIEMFETKCFQFQLAHSDASSPALRALFSWALTSAARSLHNSPLTIDGLQTRIWTALSPSPPPSTLHLWPAIIISPSIAPTVHPPDTAEAAQQAPLRQKVLPPQTTHLQLNIPCLHPNQVILSHLNRRFLWRGKTLVNHQVK